MLRSCILRVERMVGHVRRLAVGLELVGSSDLRMKSETHKDMLQCTSSAGVHFKRNANQPALRDSLFVE